MNLKVNVIKMPKGGVLILLNGWLDISVSSEFRKAIEEQIEEGENNLFISLEEVKFIDEAGVNILLYAKREVQRKKGDVRLVCSKFPATSPFVKKLLNDNFSVYKSEEEIIEEMER